MLRDMYVPRENFLASAFLVGILFSIIFAVFFALTGISLFGISGLFGIFVGALFGLILGIILGFLLSLSTYLPREVKEFIVLTIVIAVVASVLWLGFIWWKAGAFQLFLSPLSSVTNPDRIMIALERGVKCARDPVECFFKPFYDWSEPTIVENKQNEVSLRVDFSGSKNFFMEGKDITVKPVIVLKNPVVEDYVIEPKCLLDGKEMEIRNTPRIENEKIRFRRSEIEQRVAIICEKKGGIRLEKDKDVESVNFELKLIRPIRSKVEWNVYTLSKEVLKNVDNPFEGINEPNLRGRTVLSKMKFNSPIKVSIGSYNDQPFFEGRWDFSIIINKQDSVGKLLEISRLILEDSKGNVRISKPCDLSQAQGYFFAPHEILEKITDLVNKNKSFPLYCSLEVLPSKGRFKLVPEKTVISAEVEFKYESSFKKIITILPSESSLTKNNEKNLQDKNAEL